MARSEHKNEVVALGADVAEVFGSVEEKIGMIGSGLEQVVKPVRDSVFKRYPTMFLTIVTVGAVATFSSIEQLLLQYGVLTNHPWLVLGFGIVVLIVTGRIYNKLG